MDLDRVDYVKTYLESNPAWRESVRFAPLEVRVNGRWARVREIKIVSQGVGLIVSPTQTVWLGSPNYPRVRRQSTQNVLVELVRERFRPCKILSISKETDRQRHQTGAFLRMLIQKNSRIEPVIVVHSLESPELTSRLLVSLVLWWDQLQDSFSPQRMLLLIPRGWNHRIYDLLPMIQIPVITFQYDLESGVVEKTESKRHGLSNLDAAYEVHWRSSFYPAIFADFKVRIPELDLLFRKRRWELSFHGYPLAWAEVDGHIFFDLNQPTELSESTIGDFRQLVEEVCRLRRYPPPDETHPFYRFARERWLESMLLKDLSLIHPLLTSEVYAQVPTWVGGERRILDLLGVLETGRLVVIEVKMEKDLNLLFQGLDYWERVYCHLKKGDFGRSGYFPNQNPVDKEPILYLVTTFFGLHRTFPLLSRYLKNGISGELIQVNQDWKTGLKVIRRIPLENQGKSAID